MRTHGRVSASSSARKSCQEKLARVYGAAVSVRFGRHFWSRRTVLSLWQISRISWRHLTICATAPCLTIVNKGMTSPLWQDIKNSSGKRSGDCDIVFHPWPLYSYSYSALKFQAEIHLKNHLIAMKSSLVAFTLEAVSLSIPVAWRFPLTFAKIFIWKNEFNHVSVRQDVVYLLIWGIAKAD